MRSKHFAALLAAILLTGAANFAVAADANASDDQTMNCPRMERKWRDRDNDGPRGRHWQGDRDRRDWRDDRDGRDGRDGPRHRDGWHGRDFDGGRFEGRPGHHMGMRPGMGMGMGMGPAMRLGLGGRAWEQLDLTDAQKKQLVDVLVDNYRSFLETRLEVMGAAGKVRDLRENDSATSDEIIAANTALGAARGKMEALVQGFRQNVEKLLTPEQLKKLEDMRDNAPAAPFRHRR